MGHGNNLDAVTGFSKDDEKGKFFKHHPVRARSVFWELFRMISDSFDGAVEFIEKHFRGSNAAPPVPFGRGIRLFQCVRVDPNGEPAHRVGWDRSRRRASSQGMSSTAPLWTC